MRRKILVLLIDNQPQFVGGIKRVCCMLGENWIERGIAEVKFLTFSISEIRQTTVGFISQSFFPNAKCYSSRDNVEFIVNTVNREGFTILLNPHVENKELNELVAIVRPQIKARIVGVLHFAPTHNSDLIKASFFNDYVLGYNIKAWFLQLALWCKYKIYGLRVTAKLEKSKHVHAINNCDSYVVLSKWYIPMFPKSVRNKIVSINNPAPFSLLNDIEFDKKEKRVVWCGRLDVNGAKRCDRMLKIWKIVQTKCSDWYLSILGDGNVAFIRKLISEHSIDNVEVLGFCSPFEYYSRSSIICSTSTVEGLPMVLVEAQSYGCVPIVFDSYASVRDIITDGENGVLVSPFDIQKYAEKLILLMKEKQMREKMARRGFETVSRFKVETIANEWMLLFNRLEEQ